MLLNILDDNNYRSNTGYISVRDEKTYQMIEDLNSKYLIGLMQKKRSPTELLDVLSKFNIKIAQIRPKVWNEADWEKLKKVKTKFTIFYGDTPKEFEFFLKKQPFGILTNYPARLKSFYYINNLI